MSCLWQTVKQPPTEFPHPLGEGKRKRRLLPSSNPPTGRDQNAWKLISDCLWSAFLMKSSNHHGGGFRSSSSFVSPPRSLGLPELFSSHDFVFLQLVVVDVFLQQQEDEKETRDRKGEKHPRTRTHLEEPEKKRRSRKRNSPRSDRTWSRRRRLWHS